MFASHSLARSLSFLQSLSDCDGAEKAASRCGATSGCFFANSSKSFGLWSKHRSPFVSQHQISISSASSWSLLFLRCPGNGGKTERLGAEEGDARPLLLGRARSNAF